VRYQSLPGDQRLLHSGDDWSLSSRDLLGNEILHGSGFKCLKSFCCSAGRAAISSTSGLLLDSRDPFRLSYQLIDLAYCCSSSLNRCVDSLIILCSNKVGTTPCKLY
jgi:hypothetical protein